MRERRRRGSDRPHQEALPQNIRALVEYLVRALVDDPDSVVVSEKVKGVKHYYEVQVSKGDYGKVLGRGGKTISCIRSVVRAAASKANTEAVVDIQD